MVPAGAVGTVLVATLTGVKGSETTIPRERDELQGTKLEQE